MDSPYPGGYEGHEIVQYRRDSPAKSTSSFVDKLFTSGASGALIPILLPAVQKWRLSHPKLWSRLVVPLVALGLSPALIAKLPAVWQYLCCNLLAQVKIEAHEDEVLSAVRNFLKQNQSATLPERSVTARSQGPFSEAKAVSYQSTSSFQMVRYGKRVFIVTKAADDSVTIWTLAFSPKPIQDFIDSIVEEERRREPPKIRIYSSQTFSGRATSSWRLATGDDEVDLWNPSTFPPAIRKLSRTTSEST